MFGLLRDIREIRDLLREIRDALVPPVTEAPDGCQHPDNKRVDLSTAGDPNHVICSVCRARL